MVTNNLSSVTTSLLDRSGKLPKRSGLNWGQRPEQGRNPNQAYIRIPAKVGRMGFFPERGDRFSLKTDDGKTFLCTVNQSKGKAIHSCENNALLGTYFRNRLGVPSGQLVTRQHLDSYGRTDITFRKLGDKSYLMDFSV